MKRITAALVLLPLIAVLSSCADTNEAPNSRVHGSIGASAQSQNTSHISPDRPAN